MTLPEQISQTEIEKQNEIRRRRQKMLYRSKSHIRINKFVDQPEEIIKTIDEPEKRISLSDDQESSSIKESEEINEGNNSAEYNIQQKKSETFKFIQNTRNKLMSNNDNQPNRNSLSGASSSSFIETDKDRKAINIFNRRHMDPAEPSEIAKNAPEGNSDMTSIRHAFNQVSTALDSHNFKFNKAKALKKHNENGFMVQDNFNMKGGDENKLFQPVNKNKSMRQKKHKHKKLKNRSDTGDVDPPKALHSYIANKYAPSEYKDLGRSNAWKNDTNFIPELKFLKIKFYSEILLNELASNWEANFEVANQFLLQNMLKLIQHSLL